MAVATLCGMTWKKRKIIDSESLYYDMGAVPWVQLLFFLQKNNGVQDNIKLR